jgi:hypothetical protein
MDDFIDECLTGKKVKKKKKVMKESKIDVNDILSEADDKKKKEDDVELMVQPDKKKKKEKKDDEDKDEMEKPDKSSDMSLGEEPKISKKDIIEKAKAASDEYKPKGEVVMITELFIDDKTLGTLEVGEEQYTAFVGFKSFLDKYKIKTEDLSSIDSDSDTSIKMKLRINEDYINEKNDLLFEVTTLSDGSVAVNVFINEIPQTFADLASSITYFDTLYKSNILDIIAGKARA